MSRRATYENKSLKASFREGIFASAMTGFTQEYFVPFLLLLGGTVRHVAFLSALPNLIASLVQVKSADITERLNSRRRAITTFVFLQSITLFFISLYAASGKMMPFLFIGLAILFTSFGAVANPAWGSLMSDLVPRDKRGRYFGWRNRTLGFVMVGSMFLAGIILNLMKKVNAFHGFAILFGAAFLWRGASWYFLNKMEDVRLDNSRRNHFTFIQFISRLRESNFAKFVLFVSLMNFSVNIASPYFSVLMLKELQFSYLLYTVITLTATLTIYITISRWGMFADSAGNLKIIRLTSPLIGIIPLLWVINRNPLFLVCAQIASGFLWAGFNLCSSNFIYDAVTPEKRTRCIAYFNTFNGTALCIGALCGGFLLPLLPPIFGYRILSLFVISSFLRIIIGVYLPRRLKEVRPIQKMRSHEIFSGMIGIKPLLGVERKTIRY
ncbi:MAG: MFS transporter [Candidatus Omnitrophica bacterium]|nr:MFS transporter [Candidatus Omnitrophota bacterium]